MARQCGVPPAANYPMYAGLLAALDADNPEPLLNELMRFGFVRETMNMTKPLDTSFTGHASFGGDLTASCDGSDISTRSETSSAQPTGASSPRYTAASCAPFYALIGADEPAEPLTWTCGRCTLLNPLRN